MADTGSRNGWSAKARYNRYRKAVVHAAQAKRDVFLLKMHHRLTNREIAARLDISESTVKNYYNLSLSCCAVTSRPGTRPAVNRPGIPSPETPLKRKIHTPVTLSGAPPCVNKANNMYFINHLQTTMRQTILIGLMALGSLAPAMAAEGNGQDTDLLPANEPVSKTLEKVKMKGIILDKKTMERLLAFR